MTDKAIINWNGFSINVNELVKFIQPSSSAIALNRVIGADPSVILGQLTANGRVFLINPNGILFGSSAKVDAAGLLATTLNIKNDDFMAGRYLFTQDASKLPSYVVNKGEIKIADNGFVFLVAPAVSNEGLIIANLGKAAMGAGNKLTLDFFGDGLINYAIEGKILEQVTGPDGNPLSSAVSNTGTIKADGGQVLLTADASNQLLSSVINQTGIIEARTIENQKGVIRLLGGDSGVVSVSGTLDASAPNGGDGGFIETSGHKVELNNPKVTASAPYGKGGTWLIDPTDIIIDAAAAATYSSTLDGGTDVTVDTASAGSDPGDITVESPVSWTSTAALTLNADNNIYSNAEISGVNGSVTLNAPNGAIIDGNGDANNITATDLTLSAWTGIGTSSDALETQVSNLNAYTNSGNINIANTGNLTIDDFSHISSWGFGVENEGGNVAITNTGSIDMPGTDGSGVYATGDIVLTASGANSDITASTQAAQSDTGSVTFNAGRDIYLGQGGSGDIYTNNGAGSITLSAGRNITIDNGTWVQSGTGNISLIVNNGSVAIDNNASIMTDYGNIDIRAADGINQNGYIAINNYGGVIGNFTANADTDGNGAGTFTLGSSGSIDTNAAGSDSGTIEISAANMVIENGASINAGNSSVVLDIMGTITDNGGSINASNLSVTGTSGIGSSGSPLNINVETLTASSTNADIYIKENWDVAINAINAGTGNVALNDDGAITDNNGAANNITASNVTLSAGSGIGSNADPVEVTVSNTVNATSTSGGVFVVNLYVPPAPSTTPSLLPANVLSSTLTDNGFTNTGYERAANTDQRPSTNEFTGYLDLQLNTITDSHITEDLSKTDIETGMERRR
ncbi:MAG: filamentous hemagglutinin N-terminal domain-containing protein [Nitrospiraceae bacterium]|nr:filamentous hemagglutinin N-terminal domain-containing protein [Nitrospiraceae bacterium]